MYIFNIRKILPTLYTHLNSVAFPKRLFEVILDFLEKLTLSFFYFVKQKIMSKWSSEKSFNQVEGGFTRDASNARLARGNLTRTRSECTNASFTAKSAKKKLRPTRAQKSTQTPPKFNLRMKKDAQGRFHSSAAMRVFF